jgi:acyl dehydratase
LVHPRDILRSCNFVISRNVLLGPWIHTGSSIRHYAAVTVGSTLSARARVTDNYEHKGHRFVAIDALVIVNDALPVARIAHTAIYRPRQLAAA